LYNLFSDILKEIVLTIIIRDVMNTAEAGVWYEKNTKHYDPESQKLASGLPGKSGRYHVTVAGQKYWVFYSLLYSPSRGFTFSTNGQIVARREFFEDQGILLIASDTEPLYIKDRTIVLPSGYRQKVRLSYCKYEDLNLLKIKRR
jgi:hypothetical protein